MIGDAKSATLFGSHLWSKGKILTICEGEIDTMSVSQIQGHKWATVGLPQGAASAVRAKANWEYIQNLVRGPDVRHGRSRTESRRRSGTGASGRKGEDCPTTDEGPQRDAPAIGAQRSSRPSTKPETTAQTASSLAVTFVMSSPSTRRRPHQLSVFDAERCSGHPAQRWSHPRRVRRRQVNLRA